MPGIETDADLLEAQLQSTLNMIPAYTWYAGASGGLIFVNERYADYLGLPKHHPLRFGADTGVAWHSQCSLLHPDDHEETRRVWSDSLSMSRPGEVSFRIRDAQGNYRWFLSRMEPLRADDGTLLYWIGINLDIEERKQAEFYVADRKRTEERLQQENVALREEVDKASAVPWVLPVLPESTTAACGAVRLDRRASTRESPVSDRARLIRQHRCASRCARASDGVDPGFRGACDTVLTQSTRRVTSTSTNEHGATRGLRRYFSMKRSATCHRRQAAHSLYRPIIRT
jgi:PAS domain S-box-containing protein